MQRDVDLMRKIMFYIEDNYQAGRRRISVSMNGYDDSQIYEHCKLLFDGGYLQSWQDSSTIGHTMCVVGNLSNRGYDFIESVRQDTIWNKTKAVAKDKGLPMIIDVLGNIAKQLVVVATNVVVKGLAQG